MPTTTRRLDLPALSALLAALATALPAQAADLGIRVDHVASDKGMLVLAVFDGAASFLKQPVRVASVAASPGSTTLVVKDLAPGDYGFVVYHDVNANGKLDMNPMGIPIEPFAFSNDALGHMGPPSFDAVKFSVPAAGAAVSVSLR